MIRQYFAEVAEIASSLPFEEIEKMVNALAALNGRLYIIGLGGSMANAIHMAADFGKLCNIDAQAFDNVAELTARANDEGWHTIFDGFLERATPDDALMVLSVGGGTPTVSTPIVAALDAFPGKIYGIVGPNGNATSKAADICIRIPAPPMRITPHTEAFQAVIWHCLVSHPLLQKKSTKW